MGMGRRSASFIALPDHPTHVAFSPAGHRIYVTRKTGLGLAVVQKIAVNHGGGAEARNLPAGDRKSVV